MNHAYQPLLLQVAEGVKAIAGSTADVTKALQKESELVNLLWWMVLVLLVLSVALGLTLYKAMKDHPNLIEAACKIRLEGYEKAEKELKTKHALEIALNESNHQNMIKGLQKSLDESNIERRELTNKINSMAHDMAELFDTFAGKINTFAELQASQVARLETMRVEILLEITRLFSTR